ISSVYQCTTALPVCHFQQSCLHEQILFAHLNKRFSRRKWKKNLHKSTPPVGEPNFRCHTRFWNDSRGTICRARDSSASKTKKPSGPFQARLVLVFRDSEGLLQPPLFRTGRAHSLPCRTRERRRRATDRARTRAGRAGRWVYLLIAALQRTTILEVRRLPTDRRTR